MIFMVNRSHLNCNIKIYMCVYTFVVLSRVVTKETFQCTKPEQTLTTQFSMLVNSSVRFYWKRACFCDSLSLFSVASLDVMCLITDTLSPNQKRARTNDANRMNVFEPVSKVPRSIAIKLISHQATPAAPMLCKICSTIVSTNTCCR